MPDLCTPFRERYESSRGLDCQAQIRECADYVQHPEVLFTEFLESYYLVERKSDPTEQDGSEDADGELVLEPFHDSLGLDVVRDDGRVEHVHCVGGAFDPLPDGRHAALGGRGLNYVGTRENSPRIVLGVSEGQGEETSYLLLLRALNCFAEVTPPFQLARLQQLVVRGRVESDATFDLQIGLSDRLELPDETALAQLTRDLAESFKTRILEHPQFAGTLGWIECLYLDSGAEAGSATLRLDWRV